jgi:hypothetical protein
MVTGAVCTTRAQQTAPQQPAATGAAAATVAVCRQLTPASRLAMRRAARPSALFASESPRRAGGERVGGGGGAAARAAVDGSRCLQKDRQQEGRHGHLLVVRVSGDMRWPQCPSHVTTHLDDAPMAVQRLSRPAFIRYKSRGRCSCLPAVDRCNKTSNTQGCTTLQSYAALVLHKPGEGGWRGLCRKVSADTTTAAAAAICMLIW